MIVRRLRKLARRLRLPKRSPRPPRRLAKIPWYDAPDAERLIERGRGGQVFSAEDQARLRSWLEEGFMQLEGVVPSDRIDRLNTDIDTAWSGKDGREVWVEHYTSEELLFDPLQPEWRSEPHKLLDFHVHSAAAREVLASPELKRWLHILLGPKVLAFQSLQFERGTAQDIHRDTNFVGLQPAFQMVASWIALEDIEPESGELEYYVGSSSLPDYTFPNGTQCLDPGEPVPEDYNAHWHALAAKHGLKRQRFLPKKGDVLLWHAGLAHGGSSPIRPGTTRKSLVTHYCPLGAIPQYARDGAWGPRMRHEKGFYISSTRR